MKQELVRRFKILNEKGLASFIIVGIFIILLALISVGFAKIMSRNQNNALNYQLNSAASYATESALKDVAAYVTQQQSQGNDVSNANCVPPAGTALRNIFDGGNLSGNNTAKYTCMTVDPTPGELVYQQLPPSQTKTVRITAQDSS